MSIYLFIQDIVIVWDNMTTRAFPRGNSNNRYTPTLLANITLQPKEELDGNGAYFWLVNAN